MLEQNDKNKTKHPWLVSGLSIQGFRARLPNFPDAFLALKPSFAEFDVFLELEPQYRPVYGVPAGHPAESL